MCDLSIKRLFTTVLRVSNVLLGWINGGRVNAEGRTGAKAEGMEVRRELRGRDEGMKG